ncbi:MAG TPA: hypothetical protein VFA41_02440 [Ktedonobacteraceae bacterium]|jgi:hypothetical protein|nr:hypothetical protein [Ktedonobacteraceae bacterium]
MDISNPHIFSPYLAGLGVLGTITLLVMTGIVHWQYRECHMHSFRWSLRNWRIKQLSAVSCLFFLAMAASYWVIQEPWGWLYLLIGLKCGTWWIRRAVTRAY